MGRENWIDLHAILRGREDMNEIVKRRRGDSPLMIATLVAVAVLTVAAVYIGSSLSASHEEVTLLGAGATFPYPLILKWTSEYKKTNPAVTINYQSVGSGAGIQQITARTVDFGASDAPMSASEIANASGIMHIPETLGGVSVVYNVPNVNSGLRLTSDIIAGIFLGSVRKWNDASIAAQNPGVSLPNSDIIVVHRSDGSGTTYVFSDYLSRTNQTWKSAVGTGKSLNWPVGIGSKGNEGVGGSVQQTLYSVGYVEFAYAFIQNMKQASIKNWAGNFITPSSQAVTDAAAGVQMPDDMRVSIVNASGANAWPIASFTYILVYENQTDYKKGKTVADFLWWAIHDGQNYSEALYYAKLPNAVVSTLEGKVKMLKYNGEQLVKT